MAELHKYLHRLDLQIKYIIATQKLKWTLFCESSFYIEDFKVINVTKYLKSHLSFMLTTNVLDKTTGTRVNLDEAVRKVTANMKIIDQGKVQNGLYLTINKQLNKDPNKSSHSASGRFESKLNLLKTEIALLKEINNYLENKHGLQNEIMIRKNIDEPMKTFAEITLFNKQEKN